MPHRIKTRKKAFKRSFIILFLVILIVIPLYISFNDLKTNNQLKSEVYTHLIKIIKEQDSIVEV
ncbi:MAG: hypothetical protein LBU14_02710 [Candidatus Peribacteria bacterium]|nr:hypothetical protein [Candidatus Peribacteria bacterium]